MRTKPIRAIFFIAGVLVFLRANPALSYWEWTPQTGRWINPKLTVKSTPKEQFEWAESFRVAGDTRRAISEYRKLVKHYPRSEYAPQSYMMLGNLFEEAGDAEEAFEFYQKIIDDYPGSPLVQEAVARQSAISEKVLTQRSRGILAVLANKEDRAKKIERVIANDPYGSDAPARYLKLGDFYVSIEEYTKAAAMFQQVVDEFPHTPAAETARYRLICARRAAIPEVCTDTTERQHLREEIDAFLAEYPQSSYASELRAMKEQIKEEEAKYLFDVAAFYERTGKPTAASVYYRKTAEEYPETRYGAIAKEKLVAHSH